MAEGAAKHICDWCFQDAKTAIATHYCFECSNKLCKDCVKTHEKCKTLNNHKLVVIEGNDFNSETEACVRNITKCSNHPLEIVKYICKDHDEVCCNVCAVISHRKCGKLVLLSEESRNNRHYGSSTLDSLIKIDKHISTLLSHEKNYRNEICESKDRVVSELVEVKNEIDGAFKTLQETVLCDVDQRVHVYMKKSDSNSIEIEQLSNEITSAMRNAEMVTDAHDPVLCYLFDRQQRKLAGKFHLKVNELVEKISARDIKLIYSNSVRELCEMMTGSLKIEEVNTKPNFSFRQDAASDSIEVRDFTKRNATFEYESVVDKYSSYPYSPTCVWIGQYIIVSIAGSANSLVLYDSNIRAVVYKLPCIGPWDITAIDNTRIAVCYNTNVVDIVSVHQNKLIRQQKISTHNIVTSISMNTIDNELVCLSSEAGVIECVSLNGLTINCVQLDTTLKKDIQHISVYLVYDKILRTAHLSLYNASKIVSFDRTGHKLHEMMTNQQVVIERPRGIAVDSDGNVYIVNDNGKSVLQIDRNLKYIRTIISNQISARCLAFNNDFTRFALATKQSNSIKICVYTFD